MDKLKLIMPFLILFLLTFLLAQQLFFAKRNELPSALLGESVPPFLLPALNPPKAVLTSQVFLGRVTLLNVWATWCQACAIEHQMLMKIKDKYHVPIYGLNYKDDKAQALMWLLKNGNPYVMVGQDLRGDVAIDFGVYGTPETFVISPRGRILYRHVGPIDEKTWHKVLYPLIRKYEVRK